MLEIHAGGEDRRIQVSIAFDRALMKQLKDAAAASCRSLNGEVRHRLLKTFEGAPEAGRVSPSPHPS
jgi:hypothetical protein